jgi:hypothetical protein
VRSVSTVGEIRSLSIREIADWVVPARIASRCWLTPRRRRASRRSFPGVTSPPETI